MPKRSLRLFCFVQTDDCEAPPNWRGEMGGDNMGNLECSKQILFWEVSSTSLEAYWMGPLVFGMSTSGLGLRSDTLNLCFFLFFLVCLSPLLSCFGHTPRNYLVLLFLYSLIEFPFVTSKRKIVWLQFIMLNFWITQKFNGLKNSKFNHLPPPPSTHTHIYIKTQNSNKIYLNFI